MSGEKILKLAQQGELEEIRKLVKQNFSDSSWTLYSNKRSGDTVLAFAARHGHVQLVRWLHESCGMDLELANLDGKRPLHEAAQFGQIDCLQYLLSQGVQVDSLKRADWTPLMLACTKTSHAVVKSLIEAGAAPNLRNKDGWNSLHIACREGDADIVNYLLDCDGSLWDTTSKNGRTPLHTAALHGNLGVIKLLLDQGYYKVDTGDSCGTTPLMDAIRAGHIPVAEELITKHKASVTADDNMGRQPLHLAAQAGCEVSVSYLLDSHHVDINSQSSSTGVTPLHLACKEGHGKIISLLLERGADIHSVDKKGRTALHLATGSQFTDCVKILQDHGAEDVPDTTGTRAADLAVKEEIKALLIKHNMGTVFSK